MNFGEIIVPRQLSANGVTVHVTAAQQSFAVPVQERYCSPKCFTYGLKRAGNRQQERSRISPSVSPRNGSGDQLRWLLSSVTHVSIQE